MLGTLLGSRFWNCVTVGRGGGGGVGDEYGDSHVMGQNGSGRQVHMRQG